MIESWYELLLLYNYIIKGFISVWYCMLVAFWKSIFFLARILPTSLWVLSFLGKHNAPTNIWVSRMLIIGSAEIVGVLALPDVQPEEKLATF